MIGVCVCLVYAFVSVVGWLCGCDMWCVFCMLVCLFEVCFAVCLACVL